MQGKREGLLWVIIAILVAIIIKQRHGKIIKRWWQAYQHRNKQKRKWSLKPQSPEQCPSCQAEIELRLVNVEPVGPIQPWSERKGRGGRKKVIDTQGFACTEVTCEYEGIRDVSIHALVGDGKRGATDRIQRLRCQACGDRFTARRETILHHLKTPVERIEVVLSLLAEGVAVAALVRVFGHEEETIMRWLTRAGKQAGLLHDHYFHDLMVEHIQVDELYAKVRGEEGKSWVWAGIEPRTKIVPSLHVGQRTTADAHRFTHDFTHRLAEGCVPVFTSDGLRQYFWALTAHFGQWMQEPRRRKLTWVVDPRLLYGQMKKLRTRYRVNRVITAGLCGQRSVIQAALQTLGYSGTINTAYIERFNLTLRQMVASLTRKTWALAQSRAALHTHLMWGLAYYHFIRPHSSLNRGYSVPKAQRERTPAMAAGLTDHRWRTREFLRLPLAVA